MSNLVHYGHPGIVHSVMVDGTFLMRDRTVLTIDEPALLKEAQAVIAVCGGLTGVSRVSALAEAHDRPLLPHVWGSTVNFHAALHLTATLPARRSGAASPFPWLEYDVGPNPPLDLVGRPALQKDGTVLVPEGPGLGIEITAERLAPFLAGQKTLA